MAPHRRDSLPMYLETRRDTRGDVYKITTTKKEYEARFILHTNLRKEGKFVKTIDSSCCIDGAIWKTSVSDPKVIRVDTDGETVRFDRVPFELR